MKRVVLVLCLVAAIALPGSALAGLAFPPDNSYQGRLEGDPNTYFGFDVHKRHKRLKRVNRIVAAIPLNCYSGAHQIVNVRVPGSYKVTRLLPGRNTPRVLRRIKLFEVDSARIETDAGAGTAEVFGILMPHGRSQGTIWVYTRDPDLGKCYSGGLGWQTKRGAHVTLPAANP
jgi:hypothetical protein